MNEKEAGTKTGALKVPQRVFGTEVIITNRDSPEAGSIPFEGAI